MGRSFNAKTAVTIRRAQYISTEPTAMNAATSSEAQPGGEGRLGNPAQDRRFATNKAGPAGQGRVQDRSSDPRPAQNRPLKSTGMSAWGVMEGGKLAATVSAYLDGKLAGVKLAAFEAILRQDEILSQELAWMQWLNHQLKEIGADILAEPIPGFLLEALSPAPRQ
jgi:hypothetical protein